MGIYTEMSELQKRDLTTQISTLKVNAILTLTSSAT